MANGTVTWFTLQKDCGFKAPDTSGKDVFISISSLERASQTGLA